ncbi:MAG: 2-oxo acid dehydrogenase subunit E2 [Gimesia chilikensis]|uniref:2-oxo acid dehydrogenase subunit E2 n=1 Tax=Gimesia chilikensis TaxID=2605989 RepID=UPI0037AA1E01
MYWATKSKPVPLSEIGWINTTYLASTSLRCDPMLVWGTTVDTEELDSFLEEQRSRNRTMLTPAHVLVRAVAESLRRHPEVNRRVIGKKVYQYEGVNIVMPMLQTSTGEVDCVFMRKAEDYSLDEIAGFFWESAREKSMKVARDKKRVKEGSTFKNALINLGRCHRLPGDCALVRHGLRFAENYLTSIFDFTGLRHFKSRFRPRYEKRFACVYPKVTIGSILAFVSTTGVLDLHYGRYSRILYNQHCKRRLRRNLSTGNSTQSDAASPKTNSKPCSLRKSA